MIAMISAEFTVGQRVQAHPATDAWMQGDRYGTVQQIVTPTANVVLVRVLMDRSSRHLWFKTGDLLPGAA